MINFSIRQSNTWSALAFCLLTLLFLQGCGAERTTPFIPPTTSNCSSSSSSSDSSSSSSSSDSSSSSSSSSSCYSSSSSSSSNSSSSSSSSSSVSSSVETVELWTGANTISEVTPSGKNVQAITTANEFDKIIGGYMDPLLLGTTTADYFTDGQVILIYDGEVNSCLAHLEFNKTISAYDLSTSSVKVTLGYYERAASDKCSPSISHPFSLYRIKTKKLLIFEDKIQ